MLQGIGGSAGYGVGKVVMISNEVPVYEKKQVMDTESEMARFQKALDAFVENTTAMAEKMKREVGEQNAQILEGHVMMISDPFMQEEIHKRIEAGECAECAVDEVCTMFVDMFSQTEDELTRQRATDIGDIRVRILKLLLGLEDVNISDVPHGTILVAKDLTPSMTAGIVKENVAGILTQMGGKTSHSAILARALEIPAVLSVENLLQSVRSGMMVAIDGCEGYCVLEPDQETTTEYEKKREEYLASREELKVYVHKETVTGDGKRVELFGNIGKPQEAAKVLEFGGEGIGLFRTEFLFMDNTKLPTEEEQFLAYKEAASQIKGKPVIIRTLDVGGDKDIPYLGLEKEENPFLGYRAVRFCLKEENIYRIQLRALLRASAFSDIRIMVPLVTCGEELHRVKELVEELKGELEQEGVSYKKDIQVGVMIETPAASEIADLLAKEADFFSIGTNDLTQYTMAVDRGNAKVAYLYSPYQPSVLRSIKRIIAEGNKAGITVGMCGEAAADPLLIPLLISFGLGEFSVSPTSVLQTRAAISKWTKEQADKVADKVMSMTTAKEVEMYLKEQSIS